MKLTKQRRTCVTMMGHDSALPLHQRGSQWCSRSTSCVFRLATQGATTISATALGCGQQAPGLTVDSLDNGTTQLGAWGAAVAIR